MDIKSLGFGILLASSSLLYSDSVFAASDSSDSFRSLEIAYQVVSLADMAQTLEISRNPNKYKELNPILGSHPSKDKVIPFFIAGGLIHYGISKSLPDKYVPAWQEVSLFVETANVGRNYSMGLGIKF